MCQTSYGVEEKRWMCVQTRCWQWEETKMCKLADVSYFVIYFVCGDCAACRKRVKELAANEIGTEL